MCRRILRTIFYKMCYDIKGAGTRYAPVEIIIQKQNEYCRKWREAMNREKLLELEEIKRNLLVQAYRMKRENPHMSPVGWEYEMYASLMTEIKEITAHIQKFVEA